MAAKVIPRLIEIECRAEPRIRYVAVKRREHDGLLVGQAHKPSRIGSEICWSDIAKPHSTFVVKSESGPGGIFRRDCIGRAPLVAAQSSHHYRAVCKVCQVRRSVAGEND